MISKWEAKKEAMQKVIDTEAATMLAWMKFRSSKEMSTSVDEIANAEKAWKKAKIEEDCARANKLVATMSAINAEATFKVAETMAFMKEGIDFEVSTPMLDVKEYGEKLYTMAQKVNTLRFQEEVARSAYEQEAGDVYGDPNKERTLWYSWGEAIEKRSIAFRDYARLKGKK